MLSLHTRGQYLTLLDALALQPSADATDTPPALIYLQADAAPQQLSRREFAARVQQMAGALVGLGVRPRDLVVIAHTQNLESILLFWAALALGAVPSMFPTLTEKLDPAIYARNMAELVTRSGVRAVFTSDAFMPMLAEVVPCAVYGSAALLNPPAPPAAFTGAYPQDIAFLQHSSGTTGLQKGVALSHEAVLNQLAAYSVAIDLQPNDVIVSWLPLYHDMGLIAGFLLPLVQGIPLVLLSPFEWVQRPAMLLRAIHEYSGTLCWLPNFAYNHMAHRVRLRDVEGVRLDTMRLFINCSEPVRAESHTLFTEKFGALGVRPQMLAVSYAMAENTFAVTQTPLHTAPTLDMISRDVLAGQGLARPCEPSDLDALVQVSCGVPIAGCAVQVLSPEGAPLGERQVGELAVKSDSMLTGYYQRPDLQPFNAQGWYLTGDMGYMAGGEVYVVGRQKDLIINAGKNIYPQDIEAVVNVIEGVKAGRVVAFGIPDAREGTELIVVVAEVSAPPEAHSALQREIRTRVAAQCAVSVSYVQLVDARWLIKTSSGKIARAENRHKWLQMRQNKGEI